MDFLKSEGNYYIFLLLFLLLSPKLVLHAGLDKFTYLDQINSWTIERRIDSDTKKISCRAFIPGNGTWFSTRIRVNKNGELVIPDDLSSTELINNEVFEKVNSALKACRSSVIYLPFTK